MTSSDRRSGRFFRVAYAIQFTLSLWALLSTLGNSAYFGWMVHFQLFFLLSALIGLALLLIPRVQSAFWNPKRARRFLLLLTVAHCATLAPQFLPAEQLDFEKPVPLKVAWHNAQWNPTAFQESLELFQKQKVEVVGFAETPHEFQITDELLADWPHIRYSKDHDLSIFSQHPLDEIVMPSSPGHSILQARLHKKGRVLHLDIAHFSIPILQFGKHHFQEMVALKKLLTKRRPSPRGTEASLLLCDMNTTPWAHDFRETLQAGWRNGKRGYFPVATWAPFGLFPFGIPIDQVLVHGPIRVTNLDVVRETKSDHRPLILDVEMGGPYGARPFRQD